MRKLLWLAVLLAFILLPLGAYVRLSQAGLGCPDWPGCFGQPSPAQAAADIASHAAAADGPVSMDKAWKEMAHRYLAGGLGLLLLAYCWQAWRTATAGSQRAAGLAVVAGHVGHVDRDPSIAPADCHQPSVAGWACFVCLAGQ
jgi:cytochrome c oxidase assembly protein subunit 15